ncbi:succinate dehydrogenase/fumarate reductase iron-sulfur subunit [Patescibacteria group bacterium]
MAKIKIQRFDPKKDEKPYFKEYEIECNKNFTILDAVICVKENNDATLGFRHSCKAGICGSCAMTVNGRARLTCKTYLIDEMEKFGEVRIAPIGNLKILKDLIVDMEPFYKEMKAVKPWFDKVCDAKVRPEHVKKIEKSSECIWCAACFSDCPSREVSNKYLGPAASVLAQRYIDDVRDDKRRERLRAVVEKQLWMCAHCEKSTENCPQNIDPQEVISKLREESIKEGLVRNVGARHAKTITKHVKKYGEIVESRLPLGALGPFKIFKMIPVAVRMILKGKFPPLFIKKIKKWDEMKKK